jgi:hypothetical protein
MSIWTKPIDAIQFADVEAYCCTTPKPREGLRLDFKRAVPNDLSKLISAFANTLGGIILIGIKGTAVNEPEWPPCGVTATPSLLESFGQIAQQAIIPPVPIEVSGFLENPIDPGKGVVVVRVHESPAAPHAVEGGRKIYERTDDRNTPYDFARLELIERLLKRRERAELRGVELRNRFLGRASKVLPKVLFPIANVTYHGVTRWVSIMPLYPGQPLTDPLTCYKKQTSMPIYGLTQRTPEGGFSSADSVEIEGYKGRKSCCSVGMFGDVCAAQFCDEEFGHISTQKMVKKERIDRAINVNESLRFFMPTIHAGVRFLRHEIGYRGYIQIAIGLQNCGGLHLCPLDNSGWGAEFLEDTFTDEEVVMPDTGLTNDEIRPLIHRFEFAFDLAPSKCDQFLQFGR